MGTLTINGKRVKVDDSFAKLSPSDQQRTVEEIAAQMGGQQAQPEQAAPPAKPGSKEYADWALAEVKAGRKVPQVSAAPEYQPPERNGLLDNIAAGGYEMVNSVPIAGQWLGDRMKDAKAALHGTTREAIDADTERLVADNPIGATTGMVAGTVLPFMGAGLIPGVGRALGMTGGLTSRAGFGAASGGAISAVDAKTRGASDAEAGVAMGVGGALGGALPLAVRGLQKVFTPTVAPRATTQAANTLRNEGVELTAGQRTGSKKLKYLESELGGGAADDFAERQGRQFTAAVMRRAGVNADSADPQVVDAAFGQIGQQFDALAARNELVADQRVLQDIGSALREYTQNVAQSQQAPVVRNLVADIITTAHAQGGRLTGDFYKATRSRIDRLARTTADPELKTALRDIMGAMDQGMERTIAQANPGDLGAWRTVRRQYANMLVIEKAATGAGEQAASGIITPARLRAAAIGQNRRAFARGRNEFVDLANAGVRAMTPLPQSGTAPRLAARGFSAVPAAVGAAMGSPGGLLGMVGGAAAGAAVPWAAGRAALSRPGRALLSNQVFAEMPRGLVAPAVPNLLNRDRQPVQITIPGPGR